MTATIGLAMIVRNEEANLARCLESVAGLVDEIVIVDTGSADRTEEIARRYTDKVYRYPWDGDFSAARNHALAQASADWILSLDADEELDRSTGDLRTLVEQGDGPAAWFLPLHHLAGDPPGAYTRFFVLRLFRNDGRYRFAGTIHEQVVFQDEKEVGFAAGPVILHRPVSGKDLRRKRGRNLALLQRAAAAAPADPFLQYYLGVEWLGLGKPARALPCFETACRELDDSHLLFRAPSVRYLVASLKALGRGDEALCVCLEESARYPMYTDLFFEGGVLLEEREDYGAAIRWYTEAVNAGTPPPVFAHTAGTESFQAFYRLGLCHERLGHPAQAVRWHTEAVAAEPAFVYPLYHLFLLQFTELGPREAYAWFRTQGLGGRPDHARVLADLFWAAGYPELSLRAMESAGLAGEEEDLARLARFRVAAGRPADALALLRRLDQAGRGSDFDLDLALDEVLAWLALGRPVEARARALALWRRPEARNAAWALLGLLARLGPAPRLLRPEEHREQAVTRAALAVLERCLLALPEKPGRGTAEPSRALRRVAAAALDFLRCLSPEAAAEAARHLQSKADAARRWRDMRFAAAGGIFP